MTDPVARVRAAVRAAGGPLAELLGDDPRFGAEAEASEPARMAAAGPRAATARAEIELAVAAVHEGYRLHYGRPRALAIDDPDLSLLAGDRLYALGLERLAQLGELAAIGELADVIALAAQGHAGGDGELADAAWAAGSAAIGWGGDERIAAAKRDARAGEPAAAVALREAAQKLRGDDLVT